MNSRKVFHVLFVKKIKSETEILIAGDGAHICDVCIEKAHHIVQEGYFKKEKSRILNIKKPKEIFNHLNDYVIGQNVQKILSVAVYNHYKELFLQSQDIHHMMLILKNLI